MCRVCSQGCSTLAFAEEEKAKVALSPKEWKSFKLAKKVTVAKNEDTGISTVWLRFSLDSPEQQLGLPVASCFVTRWDHEWIHGLACPTSCTCDMTAGICGACPLHALHQAMGADENVLGRLGRPLAKRRRMAARRPSLDRGWRSSLSTTLQQLL